MEKDKGYLFPQIFKFSWIWNILPYYGSLPKWMLIMRRLSLKTKKIWEENREAFMEAGKELRIDQGIEVLEKIIESSSLEDKLEYCWNFDYCYTKKSVARLIILDLVDRGIDVCLKMSTKYGYKYNLCLISVEKRKVIINPNFDSQKKSFYKNDDTMWKYANKLLEQGAIMLSKESNNIIIQIIPLPILYIHDYSAFKRYSESEDKNFFNMYWGLEPSILYISYFEMDLLKKFRTL